MTLRPRQEWLIGAALLATTIVTRMPFRSQVLIGGDSINYARSLERYSIADDSPHSPGYILYVAAARIVSYFLENPNSSLVALSILCAALSTAAIYFVGRRLFDEATGITAAVLLLFSPLFWYESEVALSHIVELPWALVSVWLLYRLFFERRNAVLLAVVIGISGGFRQDVLMFLAPLWLMGTFRVGRREMLLSWAAMFVSVLAWLTPVIYLSGGLWEFLGAGGAHFSESTSRTFFFSTGAEGLLMNIEEIWWAMLWLLGSVLIIMFPVAIGALLRLKQVRQWPDKRIVFLAVLTAPALLFFTLINFSHPGYLLIVAGPVLLLIARALTRSATHLTQVLQKKAEIAVTLNAALLVVFLLPVSGINAYLFIKAPDINWRVPPGGNTVSSLYGNFSASG
ncbi:MAG: glycosyltransferase family 39 protein, partial [Actinomycetota bacterium]